MDLQDNGKPILKIKVCGGPNNGKLFRLEPSKGTYVLGRSEECDLHLPDSVLSQRHCSFSYSEDKENNC